tara:strand:- start:10756 stop:11346 length:591 start_codon:yes stop_codon:yes gene_type:complete
MAKPHTFPTLFNEVLQVKIASLKKWGYLDPNQMTVDASIYWSRNGEQTASINVSTNMLKDPPFIELIYNYNNETRRYPVNLVSLPSNLGKGHIWYFLCPKTNKRCRKLYSVNGYFYHREAFKGCMYDTQTQSKSYRNLDKTLGAYFRTENLYSQLRKKYFKKTYAGKFTKKYLKLVKQIELGESISHEEAQRLMVS